MKPTIERLTKLRARLARHEDEARRLRQEVFAMERALVPSKIDGVWRCP